MNNPGSRNQSRDPRTHPRETQGATGLGTCRDERPLDQGGACSCQPRHGRLPNRHCGVCLPSERSGRCPSARSTRGCPLHGHGLQSMRRLHHLRVLLAHQPGQRLLPTSAATPSLEPADSPAASVCAEYTRNTENLRSRVGEGPHDASALLRPAPKPGGSEQPRRRLDIALRGSRPVGLPPSVA
jgi:hypothetical protein